MIINGLQIIVRPSLELANITSYLYYKVRCVFVCGHYNVPTLTVFSPFGYGKFLKLVSICNSLNN